MMEWKSLRLSDTLLRFQFGASLFSSATQAQLTEFTQLAASQSDQGARVNDIHAYALLSLESRGTEQPQHSPLLPPLKHDLLSVVCALGRDGTF